MKAALMKTSTQYLWQSRIMRNESGVWGWRGRLTRSLLIGQMLADLTHTRQERNISLSVEIPGIRVSSCSSPVLSVRFLHKTPRGTISDEAVENAMYCAVRVSGLAPHIPPGSAAFRAAWNKVVVFHMCPPYHKFMIRDTSLAAVYTSHHVLYIIHISFYDIMPSFCTISDTSLGWVHHVNTYRLPLFAIANRVRGHCSL